MHISRVFFLSELYSSSPRGRVSQLLSPGAYRRAQITPASVCRERWVYNRQNIKHSDIDEHIIKYSKTSIIVPATNATARPRGNRPETTDTPGDPRCSPRRHAHLRAARILCRASTVFSCLFMRSVPGRYETSLPNSWNSGIEEQHHQLTTAM